MSADVTERVESLQKSIEAMRGQVSASDWQTSQMLRVVGGLAEILQAMAKGAELDRPAAVDRRGEDRERSIEQQLYLAVRSLPRDVASSPGRDAEIRRILTAWGVRESELAELGYVE